MKVLTRIDEPASKLVPLDHLLLLSFLCSFFLEDIPQREVFLTELPVGNYGIFIPVKRYDVTGLDTSLESSLDYIGLCQHLINK